MTDKMKPKTPFFLLVLLAPLATLVSSQMSGPMFNQTYCVNQGAGNYTNNSTFDRNLNQVLSSLQGNASLYHFSSTTTGALGPDQVFGRYFCRHDVSRPTCSSCVRAAAKQIVASCPASKEAVTWFENCTLLHLNGSDRLPYFLIETPYLTLEDPRTVADPGKFSAALSATMDRIIDESAHGAGSEGFMTGEGRVTALTTVYCLAQCSPDVAGSDCERCLRVSLKRIGDCCGGSAAGAVFLPSCQIRYSALEPFYDLYDRPPSTTVSPPLASTPTPSVAVASIAPDLAKEANGAGLRNKCITKFLLPVSIAFVASVMLMQTA